MPDSPDDMASSDGNDIASSDGNDIRDRERIFDLMYRTILEQASDPITVRDTTGRYVDANSAACRLLGYTRDEMLHLSVSDIAPAQLNPGRDSRLARMRAGETIVGERAMRRRDGTIFEAENSSQLLPNGLVLTISRDLTARRRAEAERLRLVAAVEQTAESIAITDVDGRATYVNRAFTSLHGFTAADVLGKRPGELLRSDAHPAAFYAEADAAIAAGQTWAGRIINRRKDGGTVELDLSISPLRDATGQLVGWVEIGRDVHRERALEAQLRQAQKLEAVGRLAGGIAHEFNNLLMAIRGYAELIHSGTGSALEARDFSAEILGAADRGKALTERMLRFARQAGPEPTVANLDDVVARVVPSLREILDRRVSLAVELAGQRLPILIDVGQLEETIANLVMNARDAISGPGSVQVATRGEIVDGTGQAADAGLLPGRYGVLSVVDSGAGIAPEVVPLLFDPFFTTKPVNRGTGLGLSIVYTVVTGAGGKVLIASTPGSGSRFDLYFPLAPAEP